MSIECKGVNRLYCEMDENGEVSMRLQMSAAGNYWPFYITRAKARELSRWLETSLEETA